MSTQKAREREIREIAIAANSGEASDEQIARLDELVRSDRQLANYAARLLDQQASPAWQGLTGGRAPANFHNGSGEPADAMPSDKRPSNSRRRAWTWPALAVGV